MFEGPAIFRYQRFPPRGHESVVSGAPTIEEVLQVQQHVGVPGEQRLNQQNHQTHGATSPSNHSNIRYIIIPKQQKNINLQTNEPVRPCLGEFFCISNLHISKSVLHTLGSVSNHTATQHFRPVSIKGSTGRVYPGSGAVC